ncbi:MAG: YHS domain-containing (seleno)protein [bacterium]
MKSLIRILLAAVISVASIGTALAAKAEIYTGRLSNQAVGGYDTVSYFSNSGPVKGTDEFQYSYKGAVWLFSSAENLTKFQENPTRYAPQYGGYCAWAMAAGKFAKGDPKYWTIYQGKLYLNYNKSIKAKWEKDIPGFVAKADDLWPAILDK